MFELGLSVPLWNAIKFLLFEFFISVIFANVWSSSISRRISKLLSQHNAVIISASNLGRLTPASVSTSDDNICSQIMLLPGLLDHKSCQTEIINRRPKFSEFRSLWSTSFFSHVYLAPNTAARKSICELNSRCH